ncbi:MAG: IMP dehydrogenase [Bacteriovoracaceae bacterium]|nr:IMP dehydrogenase [Bacteriovoracaceae bacterium]
MKDLDISPTLTYDDVLIKPSYSEILPADAILKTLFSKNIGLNIPLISAAMDTVTEAPVAIVMAQEGGIGVIHKNLSPQHQADHVEIVKKYEAGIVQDPISVFPDMSLKEAAKLIAKHKITGVLVVDVAKNLEGILTSRDMLFETDMNKQVKDIMTTKDRLITGPQGISMEDAKMLLHKHRIEKLPIVDQNKKLKGLITIRDIKKNIDFPNSNKDSLGRLRVAAAIGVGTEGLERASLLVEAGVDALVVDTAHGHSAGVLQMVKQLKVQFGSVDIIAGNVATEDACKDLIKAGVDGIKVGIGPGSICTTRVIAGIGVPQLSAVMECARVCNQQSVPIIADGGVKYSGDIVKALAAGANSVMLGSMFAGTAETPGETILYKGRPYKVYRGMGSLGAMSLGSKDRYGQADVKEIGKLVPEGIEGQVPFRGPLAANIYQLVGGIRSGMGYVGAKTLQELKAKAKFIKITSSSLKESHPHDVKVTKEAPNYSVT